MVATSWTSTRQALLIVAVVDWDDRVGGGSVRGTLIGHRSGIRDLSDFILGFDQGAVALFYLLKVSGMG